MKYKLVEDNGFSKLELSGDIDLHYSPELRRLVLSVLDRNVGLVIDLFDVDYLDSSGVACFVEAYQVAKKKKLKFSLTKISESAMQVFKLARLDQVFPIE